jgi:hypothetical protein
VPTNSFGSDLHYNFFGNYDILGVFGEFLDTSVQPNLYLIFGVPRAKKG